MTKKGCIRAALAALVSAVAIAGCEGGDSEVASYTDAAGRSCTVDLSDISLTATCDVDPSTLVSCGGTNEPAFVLSDDYDFDTMISTRRSCTACIDRAAHMTYIAECVPIECETDDDCLNRDGDVRPFRCGSGICTSGGP